ncbi:hypothetical protein BBJ28_00001546 [Nothophytophthora sp. Chile5]|nr:hypothetical protein BBJ28_00001546 [Nothophytophthora sp. Chile5]
MDLYEACENGNEERVVELLVCGSDGSHRSSPHADADGGRSPVWAFATATGLATSLATQLQTRGTAGRTALLAACLGGQAGVVRLLLGERCTVHFTSRTEEETQELLQPLARAFPPPSRSELSGPELFQVEMVAEDGSTDVTPMAEVQLPPDWVISPRELLEGRQHVDDFGNTPLQCVSCFGCGSSVKHVDDALDITRQLLLHGDQPNLPKHVGKWTPLHWSAYNGNHEQAALLLDPSTAITGGRRFGKTQSAIPLLADADNLFAVDVAGRRGLTLRDEMAALRRPNDDEDASSESVDSAYAHWRLRLDHTKVVKLFTSEFLANARHLTRYVAEMNARNPALLQPGKRKKTKPISCADAVRYGQHLLYWCGCFGLVEEVRGLLGLELQMAAASSRGGSTVKAKALVAQSIDGKDVELVLRPLYVCSCEANKRQSVLHAVAALGQLETVQILLDALLYTQQHPSDAASTVGMIPPTAKVGKPRKNLVIPSWKELEPLNQQEAESEQPRGNQLDVLDLVNGGWKNHRNESPLFVAALFLQQSVVQTLCRVLSPASLTWELQNINAEGSSIRHIASHAARAVLAIDTVSERAEYVLVFDGARKKQFKESVMEAIREESALAPSLVVTRAGSRKITAGFCRGARQIDYIVVSATKEVLVRHAQTLQLKVKHRGSSVRSKYDASSPELFEPFRSLQRQQVILNVIQRDLNLKKHLLKGNLKAIFPLHDAPGCRNIVRHWGYSDIHQRIFQPFTGNSLEQFLLERREHQYEMLWPLLTYFGEKHAFYYAFVAFYTAWLLPIAFVGAICQMLWVADDVRFAPPLFAIAVSIWATLLVERWKRKRSEIHRSFGHFQRNRSEENPGFYGDFQVETALQRTSGVVDVTFPRSLQLARIYSGIPLLLTMGFAVVVIFVAVKTGTASSAVADSAMPWLPMAVVPYVVPLLNAVSMLLLDNLYTRLARTLTAWENHRTVWQFESMLAAKLFWFKFLNAFISLFWIAFVDQDAATLRHQLLIIMGVRQLWNSVMRDVLPLLHVRFRWKQAGFRFREPAASVRRPHCWSVASHEWYNAELRPASSPSAAEHGAPPPLVFVQELMYPPDFLMGKQMEAILQFGYITMFVSVLPVAPLLALLSNAVATRLDVLSCTQAKQRPPFESETEVTTFMNILEFMSFAAVAVNCAVLFFTTRSDFQSLLQLGRPDWAVETTAATTNSELWVLLAIEHAVLGAKALLSLTIDDSASWVRRDEDRSDDEAKKRALIGGKASCFSSGPSVCQALKSSTPSERGGVLQPQLSQVNKGLVDPEVASDSAPCGSASLARQYVVALRERDEALQRERVMQRKLADWVTQSSNAQTRPTSAAGASKATASLPPRSMDVTSEPVDSTTEAALSLQQPEPQGDAVDDLGRPSRTCFLCYALKNVAVSSVKRCLSCHVALCLSCDEILHLDDLGVKETKHFRVNIPKVHTTDMSHRLRSEAIGQRRRKTESSTTLEDLRQLVDRFVIKHSQSDGQDLKNAAEQQQQTRDEVFQRCAASARIALRYLRNLERYLTDGRSQS